VGGALGAHLECEIRLHCPHIRAVLLTSDRQTRQVIAIQKKNVLAFSNKMNF